MNMKHKKFQYVLCIDPNIRTTGFVQSRHKSIYGLPWARYGQDADLVYTHIHCCLVSTVSLEFMASCTPQPVQVSQLGLAEGTQSAEIIPNQDQTNGTSRLRNSSLIS